LDQACRANACHFIDAPVSGGQQGAVNGALTIMCGGEQAIFERIHASLAHYGKTVMLMGSSGAGQMTKMVNQICIAGLVQGLAEGLHFAECAGLDRERVIEVISQGAAGSWQMDNRHATMIANDYDHGFAVDWMRKDLDICLTEARRLDARLPVAALVDQFYGDIQAMGGGRWDTSSLLKRLQSN
ncbi:MAG TPA: NAD(P)-dependent oxidoreductase, partial [Modicisalibacter sp.]|nr:NAD(P)-dependent oxidoreductase [Modicisalibacter sp.]